MNNRLIILLGGFLTAFLIAAGLAAVFKIDLTPKAAEKPGKRPARTQELGEGIKVSQHGLYGVDLVSIGKAHMRKFRKGPFTIGAINELVLEDVALVLPEDVWRGENEVKVKGAIEAEGRNSRSDANGLREQRTDSTSQTPQTGPKAMLSKLGINAGNLKMGGQMPRFSALAIRGLKVSRLEGTNAVPWFAAARGEARRGGLKLENGCSVENGEMVRWKEALLVVEPKLKLLTR